MEFGTSKLEIVLTVIPKIIIIIIIVMIM